MQQSCLFNSLNSVKLKNDRDFSVSLLISGEIRDYVMCWDPNDLLHSDVSKKHLFKIKCKDGKVPEDLFGYDVYWDYISPAAQYSNMVIVCPCVIVDDAGKPTDLVLLRKVKLFTDDMSPM